MIRQKKLIIGAGVLLLIMLGGLIALLAWPEGGDSEKDREPMVARLFSMEEGGEVSAIVAGSDDSIYKITKTGEGYGVDGYDANALSQDKLKTFADNLINLTTVDMVKTDLMVTGDDAATAKNLSEFGFDDPSAIIRIIFASGDESMVILGNRHPVEDNYYVMLDRYNAAFLISGDSASRLLLKEAAFMDTSFFEKLTEEKVQFLKEITIAPRNETPMKFVLKNFTEKVNLAYYRMMSPVVLDIERESMEKAITKKLFDLEGDDIAGDAADLSQYGLDAPDYTLTLDYMGQKVRVLFGGDAGDSMTYGWREGAPTVFKVDNSKTEFLKTDYKNVIGKSVYYKNVTLISNVTFEYDGESYSIDIEGEGNYLKGIINGMEVGSNDLITFYMDLCEIALEGETAPPDNRTPEMRIIFSFRDGSPSDVIELIPMSDRQSAIAINGDIHFYTYRRTVSLLKDQFEASILNKMKAPA